MALVRRILGKFLGVVCYCFPPDEKYKKIKYKYFSKYIQIINNTGLDDWLLIYIVKSKRALD
jgi:hypothetical protein